ncbi:hypothetical protein [Allorhizocola rhizosphaerae]|uniref:hypothetical protein n=1 Tax=Allorhizocola rhizosphaerae TaxID=1872709 RepID=UPI000E3D6F62|nr:hypothetical protein [Allorhizocola rhizosphaerae]
MVASTLAFAGPAQAYTNADLSATEIRRETDTCPCSYPDPADGAFFQRDVGGVAIKVEWRYPGRGMVAKAEWHPYGEVLWVYDTENDGDTIYVGLLDVTAGVFYGPYAAPGLSSNSAPVGHPGRCAQEPLTGLIQICEAVHWW